MNASNYISKPRIEYHNGLLCVEASWLIETGFVSESNYKNLRKRKQLKVARRGCKNTPALVEYESMPMRFKEALREQYGSLYKRVKSSKFQASLEKDSRAAKFYSDYRLESGKSLPQEIQWQYRANAEVLNAVHEIVKSRTAKRRALGGKAAGIWEKMSHSVAMVDKAEYPHNLPSNHRRLQAKYKEYVKEGYSSLVSRKYGNDNSKKVTSQLERLIVSLKCLPNKPYNVTVHDLYHQFLYGAIGVVDVKTGEVFDRHDFEKNGKKIEVTESTIWNYVNKPKNQIVISKYTKEAMKYNGEHRPHHHRKAPQYSMSKVSMDDRDIMHATNAEKGRKVKAYYAADVMSGCIIGASHSLTKRKELFIDCVRDMFQFLRRNDIGMPLEVEVENHLVRGFEKGLMKAGEVFDFVRWCNPANSQEKYAENIIRMKKYSSEKRNQPNIGRHYAKLDANKVNKKKIFDAENDTFYEKKRAVEAIIQDDLDSIKEFNNSLHGNQKKFPGKTRLQVFMENLNPKLANFDATYIMKYIGKETKTSIKRTQSCRVQYADYQISSPEVIKKLQPNNRDVLAYHMPADIIDKVWIYQNGVFICEATKIEKYASAKAEWKKGEDDDKYLDQAKYVSQFDKMVKDEQMETPKAKIISKEVWQELNKEEEDEEEVEIFDCTPREDEFNFEGEYYDDSLSAVESL